MNGTFMERERKERQREREKRREKQAIENSQRKKFES